MMTELAGLSAVLC